MLESQKGIVSIVLLRNCLDVVVSLILIDYVPCLREQSCEDVVYDVTHRWCYDVSFLCLQEPIS